MKNIIILFCLFSNLYCFSKDNWTKAGDIGQIVLPATALGLTFYKHDKDGRKMFYKSYLSSMLLTYAMQKAIPKARPNISIEWTDEAYVSGHTASAFCGASIMQRRYGWKIGAPAYVFASYVGWSRIHGKKHETSDVLRGATIGILGAYCFTKPISKNAIMYPIFEPGKYGLMINAKW